MIGQIPKEPPPGFGVSEKVSGKRCAVCARRIEPSFGVPDGGFDAGEGRRTCSLACGLRVESSHIPKRLRGRHVVTWHPFKWMRSWLRGE